MKKFLILTVTALLQIFVTLENAVLFDSVQFCEVSIADYLVVLGERANLVLILGNIMLLLSLLDMKNDFNGSRILIYSSRKKIVKKELLQVFTDALLISTTAVISSLITGVFLTQHFINWEEERSLFKLSFGESLYKVRFFDVLLMTFLSIFVFLTFLGIFSMILKWMNIKIIYLFLLTTSVCIIEICTGWSIFSDFLRIRFEMWMDLSVIVTWIVLAIVTSVVSIYLLKNAVRKKEFIGC